jgi:neopullulanase
MRVKKLLITPLLLGVCACWCAAQPVVTKVEPPDWWADHTINPVRLLIRGTALGQGRLTGSPGFSVSGVSVNERGTYLFADVTIPPHAAPGDYPLTLSTPAGTAKVPFRIDAPLSTGNHFRGFSNDDIIYLLMPDRFADGDPSNDDPAVSRGLFDRSKPRYYHGGDFQGVIDHLPYLKELGVTAIWMTPIYDNNNGLNEKEVYDGKAITDYHGYGAVDYYGVEEHFGDLKLLRKLVEEAHKIGIKVIQDQVANHVGPYHPWVNDSPTPTWFHGTAAHHINETWQVWTLADPNSSPQMRRAVTDGWFIDLLPDMNQEDPEVREYEIQNTLWWLGSVGFDGIRQDTWPYVPRNFWRDWMAAIKRQFPAVTVVGELFDGDPALVSFFQGGRAHEGIDTGLDSVFDFPVFYKLRDVFAQGKPIREVANMLGHDYLYPRPEALVTFFNNHDTSRFMNDPGASVAGLKLALTCLLTLRGIPALYYGDEIGMTGGNDPDNRRDFPGGWKGDSRNAFTAAGRTGQETEIFEHARKLTHLRQALPALREGSLTTLLVADQQWAYARRSGSQTVVVVFNNATGAASIRVPLSGLALTDGVTLRGQLGVVESVSAPSGQFDVSLPARSAEVFLVSAAGAQTALP